MKLWPQTNIQEDKKSLYLANLMKHLVGSDYANLVMGLD
jgi:hypothetical protein